MRNDWRKKIIVDCGLPDTEMESMSNGCLSTLGLAAMDGSLETVKYLIEVRGVDPSETLKDGVTVLHYAARGGNLRIVEEQKMSLATRTVKSLAVFHFAVISGRIEAIRYMEKVILWRYFFLKKENPLMISLNISAVMPIENY